jgi:hypothetical protein
LTNRYEHITMGFKELFNEGKGVEIYNGHLQRDETRLPVLSLSCTDCRGFQHITLRTVVLYPLLY